MFVEFCTIWLSIPRAQIKFALQMQYIFASPHEVSAFALGNAASALQEMFPVVFQTLFAGEPFGRKFSQTASDLKIQSVVFDNPRYVQASLHVMKTLCFNCYLG